MAESNPVEKVKENANPGQNQERTWATFCHLSSLLLFIFPPIGHILGPLVIWLIKKNDIPLVNEEGRAVLNFQISWTIYFVVTMFLCLVGIGFILIGPVILANVILVIMASIKTSNGEKFQYPCTIHLIK
ncbi:MAG: DUF4870 domain-containing protein [Candidatus Omnitrophica bacterium]|nr:DUF4870 domain-containing protein [Candidatus Omnitrophota bacterium]